MTNSVEMAVLEPVLVNFLQITQLQCHFLVHCPSLLNLFLYTLIALSVYLVFILHQLALVPSIVLKPNAGFILNVSIQTLSRTNPLCFSPTAVQ